MFFLPAVCFLPLKRGKFWLVLCVIVARCKIFILLVYGLIKYFC